MSRSFDDLDDSISLGNTYHFTGTNPMTVSAWFKINSISNGELDAIVSKYDSDEFLSGDRQWILRTDGNGTNTFIIRGHREVTPYVTSTTNTYSVGVWIHATMTYNGSIMYCYVNGVLEGSVTIGSIASGGNTTTSIGSFSDPVSNTIDGKIAYVQIFNRFISQNENIQIMRFPGSITLGLVGFWPLLGGSPEPDYSGNRNNGTVTGATVSSDNPPINGIFQVPKPELIHCF